MKKVISILTATRAEYGLLKPLVIKINKEGKFEAKLVVTGAHLSSEFGRTVSEIESDGLKIDDCIEILLSSDTPTSISKTMGLAMISFADYFKKTKPDLLIVLGDRYETLAVSLVAMNQRIPIAHIHGGEITEGALDDSIRHALTKLSCLHFPSTEEYRKRVVQLGEDPKKVFNVGAIGVENILRTNLYDKNQLEHELNLSLDKEYAVGTFHPVTTEYGDAMAQINQLLDACSEIEDVNFIFTKANADSEGRTINKIITEYSEKCSNIFVYDSLGNIRYLSLLKYASFVIGNSSSGIIEAPTFKIPTINIGTRQKGRVQSKSVINSSVQKTEILSAIEKARDEEFKNHIRNVDNPYGNGDTVDKIYAQISKFLLSNGAYKSKRFYDIGFDL